jgi:hypothetical protein
MSAQFFNSLSGYTVGIPPVQVIDGNGNLVSNVFTSGNVFSNAVYSNTYYYANGQPLSFAAAGSNTQVQFNNNGAFAADANFTYNTNGEVLTTSNLNVTSYTNLGSAANITITGGNNGYFLQTDGTGNITWAPAGNASGGNGTPGGANSQVQFNNDGNFGGAAGFTYNTSTSTLNAHTITGTSITANTITSSAFIGNGSQLTGILINSANYVSQPVQANITSLGNLTSLNVVGNTSLGLVSNVSITGGFPGYILTTDGSGNLTWENPGSGQGRPGGTNTSIQFNDDGNFNGSSSFTYNKLSSAVNINGNLTSRNFTSNNQTVYGCVNVTGSVTTSNYYFGDGSYLTNVQSNIANYVAQSSQPNITSVGTLLTLSVTGNILTSQYVSAGGFQTSGSANSGSLNVSGMSHLSGSLNATGNANFSGPNVNLGSVSNLHIEGGLNGYFLSTDGLGGLSWQAAGGGSGNTNPGGSNTQIQYNNAGNFAGSNYFTFNSNTNTVQVAGTLVANVVQVGSGSYQFGTSEVYFANTSSTSTQVIYTIPVSTCSGVDFEIIATDSVGQRRQSAKFSSLYYAGVVEYSEYAGLNINGGIGNFQVVYNPGNVLVAPSLDMQVTPSTADPVVYKMLITILAS